MLTDLNVQAGERLHTCSDSDQVVTIPSLHPSETDIYILICQWFKISEFQTLNLT